MIDQSKLRFNEEDFLERVFDPYYVETKEYSDLLVQDIPKRQRANIAIQTILRRNEGKIYPLGHFINALFDHLESAELSRVYKIISDELKTTTNNTDIRYLVHICPGKYWDKIEQSVRIRTESILYSDFSKGSYDKTTKECGKFGALATWITANHLENFAEQEKWTRQAVEMLKSEDACVVEYVEHYFWSKICHINKNNIFWPLKYYFKNGLNDNNQQVIEKLKTQIVWEEDHPWWSIFAEELKSYPDIQYEEFPF